MTQAAPARAPTPTPAAPKPPTAEAKPAASTEFPPPVRATIGWLERRFAAWYRDHPPPMPDRFTRREFGFILWPERPGPPPFVRHRAYESSERLHGYLRQGGPHSVYYSTAYYRRPGEMKMLDKQWLGAELIFDLDADHLAEVEAAKERGVEVPVERQLELVKGQFLRLIEEFLMGDFGLAERDILINFSGSRGYHAHVTEPGLMALDAKGRREVVDYVTGKFPIAKGDETPDLSSIIQREPRKADAFRGHVSKEEAVLFPTPDQPGWPGRLARQVIEMIERNVLDNDPAAAREWLCGRDEKGRKRFEGIGPQKADDFLRVMTRERLGRYLQGYMDRQGQLRGKGELTGSAGAGRVVEIVFEAAASRWALPLARGETDEPVTADTKRLIRLPGSLHGKSGLKAVPLRLDEVKAFDPFREAVAFGKDAVRITPRNDAEVTLAGERVAVRKGEAVEIPEAHAVWLLARQQGTVAANR